MPQESSYAVICAQVNASFEVRHLIEYIKWHPEKLVKNGDMYLALCPIHRDEVFRTLALNPRNNTYHCRHVNCPGNHPADFLDLLQKVFNKSLPEVLEDAIRHFSPEYFRLNQRQVVIIGELVKMQRASDSHRTDQ
jgi:hypothetical protein